MILLSTGFTILLEYAGWLRGFELAALDSSMRARLHLAQPKVSRNIIIVTISDEDYRYIFAAKSPLDARGVEELIKAISSAQPAVLAVDIDTSDEAFKSMKIPENVPIVWATGAAIDQEGKVKPPLPIALGDTQPQPSLTGIAVVPSDSDGIVRAYMRKFGSYDSFEWIIAKAYCARVEQDPISKAQLADSYSRISSRCDEIHRLDQKPAEDGELSLDLLGDRSAFQHFTARSILDAYHADDQQSLAKLKGTVVLLGGLFYAARDEYPTPVGRMAGVELTAHAIDSELRGGGFHRPAEVIMLSLNLVGGIGILLLFIRYGLGKGCLISGLVIVVIAPLWSLLAFRSFAYTAYFLPIFFALLVHQLYEQAHYYQHQALHKLNHPKPQPHAADSPADPSDKQS